MQRTGARVILDCLEQEGVDTLFGYPGGALVPIYDALRDSRIRHILVRSEQSAAHAASGYARSTGRVGVCMATSGPGATNLITGIATAYMDSVPLVALTGQVATEMVGTDAFQEADITGATEPFTKHNYLVKRVDDIPRIFKEAFHIASTGRPGPVLIDLPLDIQKALTASKSPEAVDLPGYKPTVEGHGGQLKKLVKALEEAKRPLFVCGGGVISSDASCFVKEIAEKGQIPVATTLMGIGSLPSQHPLSLGMLGGAHGVYAAKRAVEEADLLIVVGARLADRSTGPVEEFAKKAMVIHVDIDPAEIGKNVASFLPIVGDARRVLEKVAKKIIPQSRGNWIEQVSAYKKVVHGVGTVQGGVHPMKILQMLGEEAPEGTLFVTDVGQHQIWAGRYLAVQGARTFLTSGGLGTMGYGLPAALGAKAAHPDREVVLITGDGSFQMTMMELATSSGEGLPIKIILLNNGHLGMVRELQDHLCEGRYNQVDLKGNPDFSVLVSAYGFQARRIEEDGQVREALRALFSQERTTLYDVVVHPQAAVIPVKRGKHQ